MILHFTADEDVSAEGPTSAPELMKVITLVSDNRLGTVLLVQAYNADQARPNPSVLSDAEMIWLGCFPTRFPGGILASQDGQNSGMIRCPDSAALRILGLMHH
jgi:hypothetical protein